MQVKPHWLRNYLSMPIKWEEKVWGRTRCLSKRNCVEVHELDVHPHEGRPVASSWHMHHVKFNMFYVIQGALDVAIRGQEAQPLRAGDTLIMHPGNVHRFVVREPARVIEITWADSVGEDIERLDTGHVLEEDA